MANKTLLITTLLLTLHAANALAEGDAQKGQVLVDNNCVSCHDHSIYTRPNHIVTSYGELVARVEFCETQNGKNWSAQQIADAVSYLNKAFYKFK